MLRTDRVEKQSAGNRTLFSVHFKEILQWDVRNSDINGEILWMIGGGRDEDSLKAGFRSEMGSNCFHLVDSS